MRSFLSFAYFFGVPMIGNLLFVSYVFGCAHGLFFLLLFLASFSFSHIFLWAYRPFSLIFLCQLKIAVVLRNDGGPMMENWRGPTWQMNKKQLSIYLIEHHITYYQSMTKLRGLHAKSFAWWLGKGEPVNCCGCIIIKYVWVNVNDIQCCLCKWN